MEAGKFVTFNQLPLYIDDFFMRELDILGKKDTLVIHNPPDSIVIAPTFLKSRKSLNEHIAYIQSNNIKKVIVIAEDIQFLSECPDLEYIWVLPAIGVKNFDYSPVYELPNIKWLRCETVTGLNDEQVANVDYSKFKEVRGLSINNHKGHCNVVQATKVKSLSLECGYPNGNDLQNSFSGEELRNLSVCQSPITSLSGIEVSRHLRRLELSYNHKLTDISSLENLKETLVYLEIDMCGKIKDFSVLETLHNLEYLILKGSNSLSDLSFLNNMPKLRYLHLTMNVQDGDLSMCELLPYARIQNRKHYSHKVKDLPKCYSDPDETYPFDEI